MICEKQYFRERFLTGGVYFVSKTITILSTVYCVIIQVGFRLEKILQYFSNLYIFNKR